MKKKLIISAAVLATLVGATALIGYFYVQSKIKIDTTGNAIVYIGKDDSFETLKDSLLSKKIIASSIIFDKLSDKMNFNERTLKKGRFDISDCKNQIDLVRHLRRGEQTPLKFTINSKRFVKDIAGELAKKIEADSSELMEYWNSPEALQVAGVNRANLLTIFLADSYDIYWNTTPESFLKKMKHFHTQFWNKDRIAKAKKLNLSPSEVYTLASIVESETKQNDEKARVANVYLNRLRIGMMLQADPTAVYAAGAFEDRRVYNNITNLKHPYNTYQNLGLPPGPIYMPGKNTIDYTLSPEDNKYIYFCAQPNYSGYHDFTHSYNQHLRNAKKYHRWLRSEGIR